MLRNPAKFMVHFYKQRSNLSPFLKNQFINCIKSNFSMTKKKSLILFSQAQIEKMHVQNQNKRNNKKNQDQWQTINQKTTKKYTVSLIGEPNSGKSTLFNCLIGQNMAIVDKLAGLTRDRKEKTIIDGMVKIVDTPGVQAQCFGKNFNPQKYQQGIKQDIFKQTIMAVYESDLAIIVIDAKKPISKHTIQLVRYIRSISKNSENNKKIDLVVACNKCDGSYDEGQILNQVYKLGIDKIFLCSGQQGTGIFELIDLIKQKIPQQLQSQHEKIKKQRIYKFEKLIDKLKQQMKQLEKDSGINIKQWQKDFRVINPQPQLNQDLDYQNFQDYIYKPEQVFSNQRGTQIKNLKMKNTIKICFVGRPNVGKSSIINQLIGQQRLVVSETPHTTRDSIVSRILYKHRKIELIDTAGLNYSNFDRNNQEYLKKVQVSTMISVKQAHVVIYTMDAFSAFKITDFQIIQNILKEGRPIIIAVNKWESIKQQFKYKAINYLKKQIKQNLGHQLHGYPLVFISAKMHHNLNELLDLILKVYDKWNSRISTGLLNNWLQKFKKLDNLPKEQQMMLNISYLIQARVRPPHFVFFVNNKRIFKDNYLRFVTDNIAKQFGMQGVPARITLRSSNNNENKKKSAQPKKVSHTKMKMQELKKKYRNFGLKD